MDNKHTNNFNTYTNTNTNTNIHDDYGYEIYKNSGYFSQQQQPGYHPPE